MRLDESAKETILQLMKIEEIDNVDSAFSVALDSIAAIAKDTGIHDLKELFEAVNFSILKPLLLLNETLFCSFESALRQRLDEIDVEGIRSNQIRVQRLLQPSARKKLAAYYTKEVGLDMMSAIVSEYTRLHSCQLSICDPFLGSGRTLSETIARNPKLKVSKAWGIEPHPLSALVAYSAILHAVKGDQTKVEVLVGDAFKIVGSTLPSVLWEGFQRRDSFSADVILTNPPFTRWEILEKNERSFLMQLVDQLGYGRYVSRRQLNLQILSLFIMDYVLRDHGLLVSVLPASTFYTIYGEAAKRLLNAKYQIHALMEYGTEPSFSIDSGFKELILVATKNKTFKKTAFVTLNRDTKPLEMAQAILRDKRPSHNNVNWVNSSSIPSPWGNNWLTLFGRSKIRDLLSRVFGRAFDKGTIEFWRDSLETKRIVRGVEMYGPDFFFVPNKFWKVVGEKNDFLTLENDKEKTVLEFDRRFLAVAFRKPEFYRKSVTPSVEHYLVAIPPKPLSELPESVRAYVQWGKESGTANPAIHSFGEVWYSHVYRQLKTKKPFGRVFLPDKIDPSFKNRGVFSFYSDQPITASKNFYIVTLGHASLDKAVCAWFNCTVFLAYFLVSSRKIADGWTRFLEDDYLRMPIPKVDSMSKEHLEELVRAFDSFSESDLPSVRSQIGEYHRGQLDAAVLNALGVENAFSRELWSAVLEHFKTAESG